MTFGTLHGALRASVVAATLALPAAALSQQTAPPPPAPAAAAAGQVATPVVPAPKPFEEIVKLWKGNLSEDFIKRKIDSDGVVYHLSADDIIACKAANVPESLIEAMMKTATKQPSLPGQAAPLAGAAAAVGPAAVAAPAALAGAAPAVPAPNYAALADRTWEGVVLRNSGVVLFKSRWDPGRLTFKEEKFTWIDAHDEKKNRVLPAKAIKEQFLVYLKGTSTEGDFFEWGVKTEDAEYRIRDIGWERSESRKPQELYDFIKAIYPNLVSVKYPADKK